MSKGGNLAVADTQEAFNTQWNLEDIPACDMGMVLLKHFAEAQPESFRVLGQRGFYEVGDDPILAASPEWAAVTEHCTECGNCNEI